MHTSKYVGCGGSPGTQICDHPQVCKGHYFDAHCGWWRLSAQKSISVVLPKEENASVRQTCINKKCTKKCTKKCAKKVYKKNEPKIAKEEEGCQCAARAAAPLRSHIRGDLQSKLCHTFCTCFFFLIALFFHTIF